jgi:uncharacterized protein (DUF342 family)
MSVLTSSEDLTSNIGKFEKSLTRIKKDLANLKMILISLEMKKESLTAQEFDQFTYISQNFKKLREKIEQEEIEQEEIEQEEIV